MGSLTTTMADAFLSDREVFDVVITFDVGGTEHHMAAQPMMIPTKAESTIMVQGGLLQVPQIPSLGASVRDASVNVGGTTNVVLDAIGAQWLKTQRANYVLQNIRVQVAIVSLLGTWEDRIVLFYGMLRSPSWDHPMNEAAFNITNVAPNAEKMIPGVVITTERHGSPTPTREVPERTRDEVVPILYGSLVYQVVGMVIRVDEVTPDYRIMVAGHHIDDQSGAVVSIYRESSDGMHSTLLTDTPVNEIDADGNPYSYVAIGVDADYWVDAPTNSKPFTFYLYTPGKLGSKRGAAAGQEFRFLGEILYDMIVSYSGLAIDRVNADSFSELDAVLPIELALQLTKQKTVYEWINEITSNLPVVVAWVDGRLTALAGSYTTPPQIAAHLRADYELIDTAQRFAEEPIDSIMNTVTVRYNYRNRQSRYLESVEQGQLTNQESARSAALYGARARDGFIDLWQVVDDASASRVAHEFIARESHLRTKVQYIAETRAVVHLRPLDVVTITDARQHLKEQMFIVEELVPGLDGTHVLRLVSYKELEFV